MHLILFAALSSAAAIVEPFTDACYHLVRSHQHWPCNVADPIVERQCLCAEPGFNFLAQTCIEYATQNTTLQLQVCPTLGSYKSIIPNLLDPHQITKTVAYTAAIQSVDSTKLNHTRADHYSNAVFLYWAVLMVLFTIANLWLWLHPQSYIASGLFAPLRFLRKHTQFSPYFNMEAVMLAGFFIMEVSLMFVKIPLVYGHVSLPLISQQVLKHVADRNAYMSAKLLPLVVYLGGRNGFLMTLTGWTVDRINILHRWLGRAVVFHFALHGLCYTLVKISVGGYTTAMKGPVFQLGTATLITMLILFVQSMRWLRRYHYELFLILHITLWKATLVLGYFHTRKMSWGRNCFMAALGLWLVDHCVRILKISLNGGFKKTIVTVHDNQVVELMVPMEDHEDHCGTFAFVHFANLGWWQSHPLSYYCDGDHMRFHISPRKGMTAKAKRLALYKSPKVLIDGPYGTRPNLDCFETLVFVVGGIGITSTIGYLRSIARLNPNKNVFLHWAVRSQVDLELANSLLKMMPGNTLLTLYLSSSRKLSSVESLNESVDSRNSKTDYMSQLHYCLVKSRLCVREVVSSSLYGDRPSSVGVVVCGPPSMMAEARGTIYESIGNCTHYAELYEHMYSW